MRQIIYHSSRNAKPSFIVALIFGVLSAACIFMSVYFLIKIPNPKSFPLDDIENLEKLVYEDVGILLESKSKTSNQNNRVLEYYEESLSQISITEFEQWKGKQFMGDVVIFDKAFRVHLKYSKYSVKRNSSVKEENWFDAVCYAQVKDGKLMDTGILMVNNSLTNTNRLKTLGVIFKVCTEF